MEKTQSQYQKNSVKKLTNDNYVQIAEDVIYRIKNDKRVTKSDDIVTTTKLRSILSLNMEIYNRVVTNPDEKLSADVKAKLQYLKVRIVYEMGRFKSVKIFSEHAQLLKFIDNIGDSKAEYMLFEKYLEALVAYRKYIIGHDK